MSDSLAQSGQDGHQAQWEAKLMYLLLPTEDEEAVLDSDRMPFTQPEPTIE